MPYQEKQRHQEQGYQLLFFAVIELSVAIGYIGYNEN
jgi:hypothetical protein